MSENINFNCLPQPSVILQNKEFFKGKDVFITGGSGFMGKVLIEKLLWSCEEVGNVYVLIRSKKGCSIQERLEKILNLELFDRLKKRNKDILNKVIPINGDIMDVNLGLSEVDENTLKNNASVVFHVAANVRFSQPLKMAILTNTRGTRDVVNLARCMKKLSVFVHVSTAYSNTHKQYIDETIHDVGADWRMFIKIAETMNSDELELLKEKVIDYHPNTYTFSKYLAEQIVNEYREEIPVIVLRPSVVVFCLREPMSGWVDSISGTVGLWLGFLTGLLHVLHTTETTKLDHITCDVAINALIVSACYRGSITSNECIVLNIASGDKNRITYTLLFEVGKVVLPTMPIKKSMWCLSYFTTANYNLYILLSYLLHVIPGIIMEIIFKIRGVNFSILAIYRKLFSMQTYLLFFTMNEFTIGTKNYEYLTNYIHPDDKDQFPIDANDLDEFEASYIALTGFKKYLLNEKLDETSLQHARANYSRLYYIHWFTKIAFALLMLYIGVRIFSIFIL